jgi:hypothetical protein
MLMDVLLNLLDPSKQTTPPYVPGQAQPASTFANAPFPVNPNPAPPPSKAQLQPITNTPNRVDEPLNKEGQLLQGLLQGMGAFDMAGRGEFIDHGTPNERIEAQEAGFLSQLGRGALDYLSDPINRKQLAIGFNAMRLNPDASLARSLQGQIETEQGLRLLRGQGNRTADALKNRAEKIANTDPQRSAQLLTAANFIRNNPTNTEGISAAANLLFDSSGFAPTVSGVQTDPVTGEQYVVITDRDTMQPKRMTVGGATQLTPAQEAELETQNAIKLQDIKFAQEKGQAAMGQLTDLDRQIEKMGVAFKALKDEGAQSGIFRSSLPAFDAGTAQLRSMANQLGIDVVNSATFGALSQEELRLALRTQLDLTLSPPELMKQIEAQIRAKDKLRNELFKMAQDLTSGVGYSDYIKKYQFVPLAPPDGVPLDLWMDATPAQKRELTAAAQQ